MKANDLRKSVLLVLRVGGVRPLPAREDLSPPPARRGPPKIRPAEDPPQRPPSGILEGSPLRARGGRVST
eukprot:scaffold250825_cov17-Tisochrysis_lutea.AAC.1